MSLSKGDHSLRALCLDVGDRRIGLAISDPGGLIATPIGHIERSGLKADIVRVLKYASERQAEAIVVGMPISLNGKIGPQAKKVEGFLKALQRETDLPIDTADERFSTAEAERVMRQSGRQPSRHKGEVDAAAAAVILQEYLDKMGNARPLKGGSQPADRVL